MTDDLDRYRRLFDLTGKVALVTGSSRGIGRAVAEALAAAGARVVVSSRKPAACEAVAESIRAAGGEATAIACNVSRDDELRALVADVEVVYGVPDVVVANAAVNVHFGPMLDVDDAAYTKIMDTNVRATLHLAQLTIPSMAEHGGGSFVVVASIAGLKGTARIGTYAVSKAALMQLARNLALEWGRKGVRVNCVAPGLVRTDFARALWEDEAQHARAVRAYPIGRLGEPEDVAGAVLFLAAPAGAWITGQTLVVDGGTTIASGEYS
ncbi:MAG: SDR family oxidoreductase [Ectothiorhodospiraceae bacterium]|nr:SDR family oxidoreductase [Ectothiorhodospiraceae bacterium]